MAQFRIEVSTRDDLFPATVFSSLTRQLRDAGLSNLREIRESRLFFVEGGLSRADCELLSQSLIRDAVTESVKIQQSDKEIVAPAGQLAFEIHLLPGVMDPVAATMLNELRSEGFDVSTVRTARQFSILPPSDPAEVENAVRRSLANDCIERVVIGTAGVRPAPTPRSADQTVRNVALRGLSNSELETLSRKGHLFLNLAEMQAVQAHFQSLGRDPTDLELETLAQTWSEHCVHKTLKSAILYRGAALPEAGEHRRPAGADSEGTGKTPILVAAEERHPAGARPEGTGETPMLPNSVETRYSNLLKDTIARATDELMRAGRGPTCLSVFKDNAGVIAFDDEFGVAFKVETHNRPSAIEPFGGAATGAGGCIRDVLGCGLGARPIANTDVFCVAPGDWPQEALPKGVLHPRRVLRGVVDGVGEYGNRMGIPTINGAVHFDPRYLGNPLVFCGCIGLIPRDRIEKAAQPRDLIVVIGGRTGRDGIHGATFSSAELTDTHADEFSHAVQIGNAIEEKRVMDAVLRARGGGGATERRSDEATEGSEFGVQGSGSADVSSARSQTIAGENETSTLPKSGADGTFTLPESKIQNPISRIGNAKCLYSAITDCGAGGLSSAIGEMGESVGATVDLEKAPLKYPGLRYDEIWISEAQERMVLAVPPANLAAFQEIMRQEQVESTVIGEFGATDNRGKPRLIVRFAGEIVGELDMHFLHRGVPMPERIAEWQPIPGLINKTPEPPIPKSNTEAGNWADRLLGALRCPSIASKEWIIRRYDHEVQGGSVIKSLMGRGMGPTDAAVLRPRLDSRKAIAVGCGLVPHLSDLDPYWMAIAAIDEAICNIVAVGGDPRQTALLDNFCWGRTDDPRQLGALVRACQACYDAAIAFGTPFISGKDSLNNEFALGAVDLEPLLGQLRARLATPPEWGYPSNVNGNELFGEVERRIRATRRLSIPSTLLISALALVPDHRRSISSDLKSDGGALFLVGGMPISGFELPKAAALYATIADAIQAGELCAVHDACGGWMPALAEMCIGGERGVQMEFAESGAFDPRCACFVVQCRSACDAALDRRIRAAGIPTRQLGTVSADSKPQLRVRDRAIAIEDLRRAWAGS